MKSWPPKRFGRRLAAAAAIGALLFVAAAQALAHTPGQDGFLWGPWDWTCLHGDGLDQDPGDCYRHHSNANARVFNESVPGSWATPLAQGRGAWDRTNGHQFDYILETSDTSSNSDIFVINGDPCGNSNWLGCASVAHSGSTHISEGSSYIELDSATSGSLKDDVAAHEFGHLMGAGHSDVSSATMWPTIKSGMVSLDFADRVSRCQIYGHSHSWWGGCP